MSANAPQPPDPTAWQAQYLRLITFPTEPWVAREQNWWQDLAGAEPESSTRKRHEREVVGIYQGFSLSLSIDLLRIQWSMAPRIDPSVAQDQPPTLGQFIERQNWFTGLMNEWLVQCPPVKRIAFAGTLLQPVQDHAEGYRRLDQYLRCVDVDPNSSDLMYRVNRRSPSVTGIPDLSMNRLSTWSVARITMAIGVQLLGDLGYQTGQQMVRDDTFACALDLDINTAPEFPRELPHDDLPRIFTELADLGVEIATRGDYR